MPPETSPAPPWSPAAALRRDWPWLALMAVAIAVVRLHTLDEPLERDLTIYMTIADGWLHGLAPYTGLWDHKPPGTFAFYTVFAALFGTGAVAFYAMGLAASLVTLAGCHAAGTVMGGRTGGLVAALAWTVVGGDLLTQSNQPNTEVFINACLVWVVAIVALDARGRIGLGWFALAGGLVFVASACKQVAVTVPVAVFLAHLAITAAAGRPWRDAVAKAAVGAAVAAAGWVAMVAAFAATGTLDAFVEAVFDYNRGYAGDLAGNLGAGLVGTTLLAPSAFPFVPLLFAGLGFALWGLVRRDQRAMASILLLWLVGTWFAVVLPGRFFAHYLQFWLPPLAVAAGWIAATGGGDGAAWRTARACVVSCCLFLPGMLQVLQHLRNWHPIAIAEFKYGIHGAESEETRQMAPWIAAHLPPGGRLYHWGSEPGVYLWSGRRPYLRFVHGFPLLQQFTARPDLTARYVEEVLAGLEKAPPDLIVGRLSYLQFDHPVTRWIAARYLRVPGPPGVELYAFLVPRPSTPPPPPAPAAAPGEPVPPGDAEGPVAPVPPGD